jgi:outer membrane lipoprotein SlyB
MSTVKHYSVISFICILFLSSCARDLSSDVYTSDSTLSLTLEGKIVSSRPIKIKNNDTLSQNSTGMLAGGVLGGIAGANVGGGKGQTAAIAGAVVAGALIGAFAEAKLGEQQGYEYIVKLDTKNLKDDYYEGTGAMRSAISSATTNGLITVVQGVDVVLNEGQNVYAIFSEKRVRLIAAD